MYPYIDRAVQYSELGNCSEMFCNSVRSIFRHFGKDLIHKENGILYKLEHISVRSCNACMHAQYISLFRPFSAFTACQYSKRKIQERKRNN